MKIIEVNGNKQYIMKKWAVTKIAFFAALAVCAVAAAVGIARFCLGRTDGGGLFHDLAVAVGAAALLFIPLIVERALKWYIPNLIVLAAYLIIVTNLIGGEVFHLFNASGINNIKIFDKAMHTFDGVVFMFFGYSLFSMLNNIPSKNNNFSPLFVAFFAFGFSMLIEYVWEIYEFTLDSIGEVFNMQRWKDGLVSLDPNENGFYEIFDRRGSAIADTMGDMIVHALGSLPVAVAGIVCMRNEGDDFILRTSVLSKKQVAYFTAVNSGIAVQTQDDSADNLAAETEAAAANDANTR